LEKKSTPGQVSYPSGKWGVDCWWSRNFLIQSQQARIYIQKLCCWGFREKHLKNGTETFQRSW
jgi:hypothetical protein